MSRPGSMSVPTTWRRCSTHLSVFAPRTRPGASSGGARWTRLTGTIEEAASAAGIPVDIEVLAGAGR
jgi:hypothetical protein